MGGLFGNEPNALMARTYFSLEKMGYVLHRYVEAESHSGVQIVRGDKLMIQTQTAKACEIMKKNPLMVET